eukprot:1145914-Pelagomonas_calceolata.AAC.2
MRMQLALKANRIFCDQHQKGAFARTQKFPSYAIVPLGVLHIILREIMGFEQVHISGREAQETRSELCSYRKERKENAVGSENFPRQLRKKGCAAAAGIRNFLKEDKSSNENDSSCSSSLATFLKPSDLASHLRYTPAVFPLV